MIFVNKQLVPLKHFNDKSFRLNYKVEMRVQKDDILWLYDTPSEALQLFYLIKHIHNQKPDGMIDLFMPYLLEARADRCQSSDEIFTLKYFADLLNVLPLHRIKVYNPHSSVAEALIDRLVVEMPQDDLRLLSCMHPDATWFFPDAGAEKRFGPLVKGPSVFGIKHRDWHSQEVRDLTIFGNPELVYDHDILLCDDIVSRGSTIYSAAKQLKEMGANNIYIYVSHCENTVLDPHIEGKSLLDYDLITKLYTTNSIFRANHPKIEIIHTFE